MRREQQIQVRIALGALDRCYGGDELIPLPRHRLRLPAEVAGIEAPAEVTNQFLQAVVPDGRVSPPGADQVIFREDDVRAADEEVEDLVLGRGQPDTRAAAGEPPGARVEYPGAEGEAGDRQHAADLKTRTARPASAPARQCASRFGACVQQSAELVSAPARLTAAVVRTSSR